MPSHIYANYDASGNQIYDPNDATSSTSQGGSGTGIDANDVGFDIVLCFGQSNIAGRGTVEAALDVPDSRVWQYGCSTENAATYQKIAQAVEPLSHVESMSSTQQGPCLAFARAYACTIPTNRRVLLVPAAAGSTALINSVWAVGGTRYNAAIVHANAAIAAAKAMYPASRFVGFLFGQGEADALNSVTQADYSTGLKATIAGMRAAITDASNAWVIINGMVPEYVAANAVYYNPIKLAHIQVAAEIAKCAYVPGVTGYNNGVHYNAAGYRIMGARAGLAVITAKASTVTEGNPPVVVVPPTNPTVPNAPTIGVAVAGDGYVDVAFTAGADGGATVTGFTATLSTGETNSGATSPIRVTAGNGVARTATVTATNNVGTSDASAASNSVTPQVASGPVVTFNPADKDASITLSNGNLTATGTTSGFKSVRGTIGKTAGKWFWEVKLVAGSSTIIGFGGSAVALNTFPGGDASTGDSYGYYTNGNRYVKGGITAGNAYTTNDVIGVAIDLTGKTGEFFKNGVSQGQFAFDVTMDNAGTIYPMVATNANGVVVTANFGATAFAYSIPAGFTALNG